MNISGGGKKGGKAQLLFRYEGGDRSQECGGKILD